MGGKVVQYDVNLLTGVGLDRLFEECQEGVAVAAGPALTDDLAAKPYESLEPGELDELMATLEPLAALLLAAQDW